ncbi:hypothetical protein JOF43_002407 [Brachybacterium sacelli]|uniref:Uncharacterized protein n=1 Tax=Brachybacterium sacelli TaxID=173364 RepID=A0ABS4X1X7_9MICO|nr:hypothetical protein [Brachybacterium sacelli]
MLESEVDGHVVGAVTSEPIDLVDDAIGDLVLLDVADHPHQLGPIGLTGGLTGVDELLHDGRTELFGLAPVSFALSRNGEALVAAALLRLFLGGHAQIRHCYGGTVGRVDEALYRVVADGAAVGGRDGHRVLLSLGSALAPVSR